MAHLRTASVVARNRGFSMIELLVVIGIAAILAIGAGQLIGSSMYRSQSIQYQTILLDAVEGLWLHYRDHGVFPEHIDSPSNVRLTVASCGLDCRAVRLEPIRVHPCPFWTLTTKGERDGGHTSCW